MRLSTKRVELVDVAGDVFVLELTGSILQMKVFRLIILAEVSLSMVAKSLSFGITIKASTDWRSSSKPASASRIFC